MLGLVKVINRSKNVIKLDKFKAKFFRTHFIYQRLHSKAEKHRFLNIMEEKSRPKRNLLLLYLLLNSYDFKSCFDTPKQFKEVLFIHNMIDKFKQFHKYRHPFQAKKFLISIALGLKFKTYHLSQKIKTYNEAEETINIIFSGFVAIKKI